MAGFAGCAIAASCVALVAVRPHDRSSRARRACPSFDSHIRGLTGTPEQIANFAREYRVYYKRWFIARWE